MRARPAILAAVLFGVGVAAADGPADNAAVKVRPVPPKGVAVPAADLAELKAGLSELRAAIDDVPKRFGPAHPLCDLLPDIEIYHKAVRYAVEYDEMYSDKSRNDVAVAKKLIKQGLDRAKELADGKPSWTTQTGLVVRGYRSKIDGSAQPYGLVVPKEYDRTAGDKRRLDFWWHGRGEVLTELNFIDGRQKSAGEFTPAGAFVLHPYGRYCNANKFAGDIDTLECLAHAKKHYNIDDSRVVARGFSMGGAACWQFAAHYPTLFAAAAPGAGFAETPEFLDVFQNEKVAPPWYEKKLWRMYNATDHARNFHNIPTVAYSGEIDKQKQAADVMARELKKVGIELTHVVGPKTGHSYEKTAKLEVNRRIDAIVANGKPAFPAKIDFITYTLRYPTCAWLTVTGLAKHWEPATVTGTFANGKFDLTTAGVTSFTLDVPKAAAAGVTIDGTKVWFNKKVPEATTVQFARNATGWGERVSRIATGKRPGLQGPIDDAFLDAFLMVKPTGTPMNAKVGDWAAAEMTHAVTQWRSQFRGDAVVKDDTAVTAADIANNNLVLWGDPASNAVLAKIADKLPIQWTAAGVVVDGKTYAADTHVPVLIFPNPLNPNKYVVLNSGFTFREYDYLNNARQVAKLPDYAVVDVTTPPNARYPGKIVRAGFFSERWQLQPNDGE